MTNSNRRVFQSEYFISDIISRILVKLILGISRYYGGDYTINRHVNKHVASQLRRSRGSVLAFGTQVRGFKPGRSRRIFQGEKILSMPSFGGEVKPSVPCRRFTARKRSLHATWKLGISGKIHRSFLAHIVPPLATRISGETTSGERWNI
jgi:hypothetical protein